MNVNQYTLTQQDVVDIFNRIQKSQPVLQIAVDCNWGPPIAERFDTDFLQVWVGTNVNYKTASVYIYGRYVGESDWSIKAELEYIAELDKNYSLFGIELGSYQIPEEYVITVNDGSGNVFYDNNGQKNYHLHPYQGRAATAVVSKNAICQFNQITNLNLLVKAGQ